jgi:hypothetical protein
MHNFAIYNILTSRVDVERYLEKIHFLTTSEKSRVLILSPLGKIQLLTLKCPKTFTKFARAKNSDFYQMRQNRKWSTDAEHSS